MGPTPDAAQDSVKTHFSYGVPTTVGTLALAKAKVEKDARLVEKVFASPRAPWLDRS